MLRALKWSCDPTLKLIQTSKFDINHEFNVCSPLTLINNQLKMDPAKDKNEYY